MGLKIQIASLAVLERLIGGDEEIQIELRQSVAENFAKKHLKGLVNEATLQATANTILREAKAQLFDQKEVKTGWRNETVNVLKEQLANQIREGIKNAMSGVIKELIEENLNADELRKTLSTTIEKQAQYITEELTTKNLAGRLDALVDQKIKQKLGVK